MFASWLAFAIWTALMAVALVGPFASPSLDLAACHVRRTVDIALIFYALAIAGMLQYDRAQWRLVPRAVPTLRLCWSLACLAFAIHVLLAFHHVHHWSHGHAMEHTGSVSDFPEGIYISHLFTLIWGCDVAWWWLSSRSYLNRSPWIGWSVHGFMAFIAFNGTVVYETGPVRWVATGVTCVLAVLFVRWRFRSRNGGSPSSS